MSEPENPTLFKGMIIKANEFRWEPTLNCIFCKKDTFSQSNHHSSCLNDFMELNYPWTANYLAAEKKEEEKK